MSIVVGLIKSLPDTENDINLFFSGYCVQLLSQLLILFNINVKH